MSTPAVFLVCEPADLRTAADEMESDGWTDLVSDTGDVVRAVVPGSYAETMEELNES